MVCVRHVLDAHLVLQFNCTNTVREQVLEDVSVSVDLADAVSAVWVGGGGWWRASCFDGPGIGGRRVGTAL